MEPVRPSRPSPPQRPAAPTEGSSADDGPADDGPGEAAASSELDLPDSAVPPAPAAPVPDRPGAQGPLGDLVAAHFRRVEIAMLGRVLITTLGGALPESMVRVQRRRSLWQRVTGRPGEPIGIRVTARDRTLSLRAPEIGRCEASAGHAVRGVVLSESPLPLSQWLDELAALLNQVTDDDEAARAALERALLP